VKEHRLVATVKVGKVPKRLVIGTDSRGQSLKAAKL
jgi:hypothetical protein